LQEKIDKNPPFTFIICSLSNGVRVSLLRLNFLLTFNFFICLFLVKKFILCLHPTGASVVRWHLAWRICAFQKLILTLNSIYKNQKTVFKLGHKSRASLRACGRLAPVGASLVRWNLALLTCAF
jgi:hypothetical protein